MKRLLLTAAALAIGFQPAAVQAQFAPVPNSQEYLNFLGAGNAVVSTGLDRGVYVGPYTGRFENAAGQAISSNFALYCVDYLHYASAADGLVNAYGVNGSLGSIANTRLGTGRETSYLKTAYLASLFETVAPADRRDTWSALHAAIWWESGGAVGSNPGASGAVLTQATAFYNMTVPTSFTGAGWYVLTTAEQANAKGQEFLIRTKTTAVPEPGTMLLMLTGLLLLVGVNRRRLAEIY